MLTHERLLELGFLYSEYSMYGYGLLPFEFELTGTDVNVWINREYKIGEELDEPRLLAFIYAMTGEKVDTDYVSIVEIPAGKLIAPIEVKDETAEWEKFVNEMDKFDGGDLPKNTVDELGQYTPVSITVNKENKPFTVHDAIDLEGKIPYVPGDDEECEDEPPLTHDDIVKAGWVKRFEQPHGCYVATWRITEKHLDIHLTQNMYNKWQITRGYNIIFIGFNITPSDLHTIMRLLKIKA